MILLDKEYECKVFCHPCSLAINDCVDNNLYAINSENIFKENEATKNNFYKINNSYFSYSIIGCVFDKIKNIVKVNNICIELDISLPNDISNGDIVSFKCSRLDI